MRISDLSSDVCSSDLQVRRHGHRARHRTGHRVHDVDRQLARQRVVARREVSRVQTRQDRKSVVWGKRVSVRVDLGGRRTIKKKKTKNLHETSEQTRLPAYT